VQRFSGPQRRPSFASASRLAALGLASLLGLGDLAVALQSAPPTPPREGQEGGRGGDRGGDREGGRRGFGGGGGMGRMFGGGGGPGGGMGGGMRDLRESLEPDFARRDVPVFVKQLKLDDTQSMVLETLMKDYEDEFKVASTEVQESFTGLGQQLFANVMSPGMRDRMTEQFQRVQDDLRQLAEEKGGELDEETRRQFFRERMQQMQQEAMEERKASGADVEMKKLMGTMFDTLNQWLEKKEGMRTKFVDSMRASLNDDQLTQWDPFDRFLRREKTLPRGRLAGESINLFLLLDELQMPEDAFTKVEPQLDDYEMRLDAALRSRNDFLASSAPRLFKAMQEGDTKDAERIMARQIELRTAVRNINDEFRLTMVSALGESEWAGKLNEAALAAGYDRIYRATTTGRSFERALEFTDLTDEVRKSIVELQVAYLSEMGLRNRDILAILQRSEPERQTEEATRFVSMMAGVINGDMSFMGGRGGPFGGDRPEDPVREALDKRQEVSEGYLERLKNLLTPEQVAELPRREGRGGGGGMARMLENMPEEARAELMKRYDKNGDGQLDEAEREEAFRGFREQFGGGGGGGGQRGRDGA
jgi:hypothetical protein